MNTKSAYVQVMVDHALALPWDRYENYDMVVWGVRERVEEGEMEGASRVITIAQPRESGHALPGIMAGSVWLPGCTG